MKPAKITLRTGRDRATARLWVDKAPPGYTLLFKPPTRSTHANARMWAFLDDIAAQVEWDGRKRTSEEWKDLFSACLRNQEIVRGLEGGIVALGARTSEMSPEEMSDLLQLIETWGVTHGVHFTDTPREENAGTPESHADPEDPARSPAPAAPSSPKPGSSSKQGERATVDGAKGPAVARTLESKP